MAKEDLKLRVTSNPPLSTKGSPLTWAELDANWIEIYNAFVALSQSSYVDTYDAGVTYDDTINNYVMYSGQLWKCIAASPIVAITPVEGANWTAVYATDMVNRPLPIDGVKRYKALLSQNAPIASTASDTMVAGQIWELSGVANPADYTFFDGLELISGTLYGIGSKYRANADTPFTLSASAIEYDGSPYIVSTDVNGDLNPFVNTLGGEISFSYNGAGNYSLISTALFTANKTFFLHGNQADLSTSYYISSPSDLQLATYSAVGVTSDNMMFHLSVEIEVYP